MTTFSNCFKFGRFCFCLSSQNQALLTYAQTLLPSLDPPMTEAENKIAQINLDGEIESEDGSKFQPSKENVSLLLDYLINQGFKYHSGLLWLDAACLIDNHKQAVLIAGQSNVGKSTIALSLAKTMNWKIVSEDITFIDSSSSSIIPFARPLSLRPDTKDIFYSATGSKLDSLVNNEWYFDQDAYWHKTVPAKLSYAILLEPFSSNKSAALKKNAIATEAYLTRVLSLSNAIRLPAAVQSLNNCLTGTRCFTFQDGQLSERLQALREIADETAKQS